MELFLGIYFWFNDCYSQFHLIEEKQILAIKGPKSVKSPSSIISPNIPKASETGQ